MVEVAAYMTPREGKGALPGVSRNWRSALLDRQTNGAKEGNKYVFEQFKYNNSQNLMAVVIKGQKGEPDYCKWIGKPVSVSVILFQIFFKQKAASPEGREIKEMIWPLFFPKGHITKICFTSPNMFLLLFFFLIGLSTTDYLRNLWILLKLLSMAGLLTYGWPTKR